MRKTFFSFIAFAALLLTLSTLQPAFAGDGDSIIVITCIECDPSPPDSAGDISLPDIHMIDPSAIDILIDTGAGDIRGSGSYFAENLKLVERCSLNVVASDYFHDYAIFDFVASYAIRRARPRQVLKL